MKTINVAAAIICIDGKFLLSKRLDHLHQGGKWEFPGGKIESGESADQALTRELQEELAITPLSIKTFHELQFDYPEKQVHLTFLWVSEISGTPKGMEQQPVEWFAKEDLATLTFPDANKPVLEKILKAKDIN